jgi:hypothetical protein
MEKVGGLRKWPQQLRLFRVIRRPFVKVVLAIEAKSSQLRKKVAPIT